MAIYSLIYTLLMMMYYCCYPVAKSCPTLCDPMDCSTPGFPVLHCLPGFAQIHVSIGSVMLSNHLILCHSLLPLSSIFPNIWIFSSELALCIRWLSLWASTSASVLPMNIQVWSPCSPGTLESLLWHHSSKASILWGLSLLYGPNLTSIFNCWKNHSFDYMDLCRLNDVFAF